jgi:hypothetical protein
MLSVGVRERHPCLFVCPVSEDHFVLLACDGLYDVLTSQEVTFVLCCVLSCLVLSCLVLSCLVLSCLASPCLALPCHALSCLLSPCLAVSCLALSPQTLRRLALSCLVLSCLVLSCLALSRLVSTKPSRLFVCASADSHFIQCSFLEREREWEREACWVIVSFLSLPLSLSPPRPPSQKGD